MIFVPYINESWETAKSKLNTKCKLHSIKLKNQQTYYRLIQIKDSIFNSLVKSSDSEYEIVKIFLILNVIDIREIFPKDSNFNSKRIASIESKNGFNRIFFSIPF
jgi:hypothetical protein